MREVKYKAWLLDEKAMVDVITINLQDKWIGYYDLTDCKNGAEAFEIMRSGKPNADCAFERCVLMQYTGLKDTNGIEIYENDVREDILGHRFVVEYDNDLAAYIGKYSDGRFNYLADLSESYLHGNIYEDSHLLEEGKACVVATEQE